jgi:ABC-type transport system substrate-binding protein
MFGGFAMATRIVMMLLVLTLVLAVACGGAAPPAPEPTAAPAETTAASVEGDTSQPTSTPQMANPPAGVEVNPGKLNVMVGDLGNERFDGAFSAGGGTGPIYSRIMGGYLISDNEKRELIPGIATDWSLSADGPDLGIHHTREREVS